MKNFKFISIVLLFLNQSVLGQTDSSLHTNNSYPVTRFTIEPGLGIKPSPTVPTPGIMVSNIIQWNISKRFNVVAHSSYTYNNAFLRDFNYIKTEYSFSLSQKFGIGTTFYGKHFSHTFSLMGGVQSDNFKETMENPEFEKIVVSRNSISPDFGLLYNLKIGKKKYFFSYRMYIPLYPYPIKSSDSNTVDGNLSNVSFEVGLGIRLM